MHYKHALSLLLYLTLFLPTTATKAQCETFLDGRTDFNFNFLGAPCDDGTGCPFYELTSFEVVASFDLPIMNFVAGNEYSFSICNGPGAGSWVPDFTIIAPSGAIDASGLGDGDSCTITWVASESGLYRIIINEENQCGDGPNTDVNNGYPAITCINGTNCPPTIPGCEIGTYTTTGQVTVCGDDDTFTVSTPGGSRPTGGGFGYVFTNDLGGTGVPFGFNITLIGINTTRTWDNTLNGILSNANLGPLVGPWVIRPIVYTTTSSATTTVCSIQDDSLVVYFAPELVVDVTDNGDLSATASISSGTPPYTYAWSDENAQTTMTATGLSSGNYSVTVTDSVGCTTIATVEIIDVSTQEIDNIVDLTVFPNPTNNQFSLQLTLDGLSDLEVSVISTTGRQVRYQKRNSTASELLSFDLYDQPNGLYIVKILVNGQATYRRILLTR